jgi:hypothetical protein
MVSEGNDFAHPDSGGLLLTDARDEVTRRLTDEYADRFSSAEVTQLVDRCWQDLAIGGGSPTAGLLSRMARRQLEDIGLRSRVGRATYGVTASRGRTVLL